MHEASRLKAEYFLKHYGGSLPHAGGYHRALEIGSRSYESQDTYKPLFPETQYIYTGLDIEEGPNVDLVPVHNFLWNEIADESFDLCISGQTFEHNPFFWVTFAEIARVLSPGGFTCIIAPGAGPVHRYPHDCWRFYPDSWRSLCTLAGMQLVEDYFEPDDVAAAVPGGKWRDSAVIARKPVLEGIARQGFYEQLEKIVAPFANMSFADIPVPDTTGPCFTDYESSVLTKYRSGPLKALGRRLTGRRLPKVFRR